MEKTVLNRIHSCGLKKKYLAEQLQISPNYLSMCLSGKRKLSEKKQNELKKLLNA